jgi:hypothetical protein
VHPASRCVVTQLLNIYEISLSYFDCTDKYWYHLRVFDNTQLLGIFVITNLAQ